MKDFCIDAKAALFTAIKNRRQSKYLPINKPGSWRGYVMGYCSDLMYRMTVVHSPHFSYATTISTEVITNTESRMELVLCHTKENQCSNITLKIPLYRTHILWDWIYGDLVINWHGREKIPQRDTVHLSWWLKFSMTRFTSCLHCWTAL